ncbi:CHAP domain-containing protein [Sphingomonas sp.]|uniref:CHAP domain-containing protein n=1 Tax=Sphingomonas sp. TaxID=28214 RepID=UPI002C5B7BE7|nr:CHAP domain-containing protein [Sphingomonas sp.]HWK36321.1 CHAP domain-containing protein [Sphingomonas sp.]
MKIRGAAAQIALVLAGIVMTATPAQAKFWQCVPYARMISGVNLYGNALTWWDQAAGRYERGSAPKEGAVLAFAPTKRMRLGHVATVSRVISDREVLLTHANWSRRGGVEADVRAVDVSDAGDWSKVKVWYAPNGGLGTSTYPTHGFIYSGHAPAIAPLDDRDDRVAPTMTIAATSAAKFRLDSIASLATASN